MLKPMLAATMKHPEELKFPVFVQAKLDGIRCFASGGKPFSRSLKLIPNLHIQSVFEKKQKALNGLDGELIIGPPSDENVYKRTHEGVMTIEGTPNFHYYVFDTWINIPGITPEAYEDRLKQIIDDVGYHLDLSFVKFPIGKVVKNLKELEEFEHKCITAGYEGIMIRTLNCPYKYGRAGTKGPMWKYKRSHDDEATILDFLEQMENQNVATVNEIGRSHRSSHKDNKVGKDTLGALVVKNRKTGVEFKVGSGFTAEEAQYIWNNRKKYKGKIIKYKEQLGSSYDKPRFPVFLGFRDEIDL